MLSISLLLHLFNKLLLTFQFFHLLQDKTNFLPEAHTCFNQLVLPDYKNKVRTEKKLHRNCDTSNK